MVLKLNHQEMKTEAILTSSGPFLPTSPEWTYSASGFYTQNHLGGWSKDYLTVIPIIVSIDLR
jgi:hypothetical protein